MLLSEWFTENFLDSIAYITANENDNKTNLYWLVLASYGNKTTSALVDVVSDKAIIGDIINLKYSSKWSLIKSAFSKDINLTAKESERTEKIDNSIYGFNSETGVKDYTNVKTIKESVEWDDVYKKIKDTFDFHDKLSYYKIIASDIAKELTTCVYE